MPIFREFYTEFAGRLRKRHIKSIEVALEKGPSDLENACRPLLQRPPMLWKTVGDESLFVNRVDSCFEVFFLVQAFVETLREYGAYLKKDDGTSKLGVKGSAWVASFPYPNAAIEIPKISPGSKLELGELESIEASADANPHLHEFLGKGLDYGFRIAQNSSDDFFAISPALANILTRARVNEDYEILAVDIRLRQPIKLKGVLGGQDYPTIGIPIDRDSKWGELRKLQEKLLSGDQSNDKDLRKYFRRFIELHEIEEPTLKVRPNQDDLPPPKYYFDEYIPRWSKPADEVRDQDELIAEGETASSEDEGEPSAKELEEIIQKLQSRKRDP